MLNNFPVLTDAQGNTSLVEFTGSGDGITAALCAGRSPVTGPNIPAMVVTRVDPDLTRLRILHNNGTPLANTNVRVNCVMEATSSSAATTSKGEQP